MKAANYYVGPTCSPTRSMLFSGVDNHVAGLGNMHEFVAKGSRQYGQPGYEGNLNDRVASMAQVLRDGGYHAYMAGKWHLGEDPQAWPAAKGFERDFTLMQGGGSNWDDMGHPNPAHRTLTFSLNGEPRDKPRPASATSSRKACRACSAIATSASTTTRTASSTI